MKRNYYMLLIVFIMSLSVHNASAQFVVALDTIRGRIDFCTRPGDLTTTQLVSNDSVFYMYPPDREIDPWRYVGYYLPSREVKSGYIRGTDLMRIDDYEMIEVSRLSSHGIISFEGNDVRVNISVSGVTSKDTFLQKGTDGLYRVKGRIVKGIARGDSPRLCYQSISVSIKGRTVVFPKGVYDYLLEPEIDNMAVYYNSEKGIVYLLANNGGTKAYYNVLWQVTAKGVGSPYIFDPSQRISQFIKR